MESYNQQETPSILPPSTPLPNATAVLVLGIISIVLCCGYGIGLICGIIALVLGKKDTKLYNSAPEMYTASSYANLKAGKVCAIIGVILGGLFLVYLIFLLATIGFVGLDDMRHFRTR